MSVLSYHSGAPSEAETRLLMTIRAKDEAIVSLQTENSMLRLKLAELRASLNTTRLQKDNMRRQYVHTHLALNNTRKKLKLCQNNIQALRFDVDEMRSFVEYFPSASSSSLQTCSQMFVQLQDQLLVKSNSITESLQEQLAAVREDYSKLRTLYEKEKKRRKALHNNIVELRGNIRVHCRVRPMLAFDQRLGGDACNSGATAKTAVGFAEEVISSTDDETVCVQTLRQQLSGVGVSTKHFDFDHVYAPMATQSDVFAEVQPLLTSLLDGYNVCLMAYGQTGSGKTHSMLGDGLESGVSSSDVWWHERTRSPGQYPEQCIDHGIIPRAAVEVFRLIGERSADCQVHMGVSVVEIYNNEAYDLLKDSSSKCDVSYKEDGSVGLVGATCRSVESSQEVMKIVLLGLQRRAEAATGVHQHSSRSHLIITLHIQTTLLGTAPLPGSAQAKTPSKDFVRTLSFDSEASIPQTPTGTRPPSPHRRSPMSARSHSPLGHHHAPLKTSTPIPSATPVATPRRHVALASAANQLHASSVEAGGAEGARVINTKLQLVDLAGSECAAMSGVAGTGLREASFINRSLSSLADVLAALAKKQQHVPYRNSKLTHVLQDAIGGDAKLLVLTCVAPAQRYITESMQCLQFGSRIRQVQRGAAPRAKALGLASGAKSDSPHPAKDRHSTTHASGRVSPRSSR